MHAAKIACYWRVSRGIPIASRRGLPMMIAPRLLLSPFAAAIAGALVLAAPAMATAEPVLGASKVLFEIYLPPDTSPAIADQEGWPLEHRFNRARCLCSKQVSDDEA